MNLVVRPLTIADIEDVLAIQEAAYEPKYVESRESFTSKISFAPDYCLGVFLKESLIGYVIALPAPTGFSMPLNAHSFNSEPSSLSSILYLHDLAVHPSRQRTGLGDLLFSNLLFKGLDLGLVAIELIAIPSALGYWSRLGFFKSGLQDFKDYEIGSSRLKLNLTVGLDHIQIQPIQKSDLAFMLKKDEVFSSCSKYFDSPLEDEESRKRAFGILYEDKQIVGLAEFQLQSDQHSLIRYVMFSSESNKTKGLELIVSWGTMLSKATQSKYELIVEDLSLLTD